MGKSGKEGCVWAGSEKGENGDGEVRQHLEGELGEIVMITIGFKAHSRTG